MSKFYYGSICLSDIPKEKITTSKNNKKYLNIGVWVNDSNDQYGNIASISVGQSKEDRDAKVKATYIGNLKTNQTTQDTQSNYGKISVPADASFVDEQSDSLPF